MAGGRRREQSQAASHRWAGIEGQIWAKQINADGMPRGTTAVLLIGREWGILVKSIENFKVKGRSQEKAAEQAAVQRPGSRDRARPLVGAPQLLADE